MKIWTMLVLFPCDVTSTNVGGDNLNEEVCLVMTIQSVSQNKVSQYDFVHILRMHAQIGFSSIDWLSLDVL